MSFEHPLRVYRQAHYLTLEKLGALAGTTGATISRIELRRLKAGHPLLVRLSDATGISIDELVRASSEYNQEAAD
jgi:transcriptional regulator with XRE-family HTH domain